MVLKRVLERNSVNPWWLLQSFGLVRFGFCFGLYSSVGDAGPWSVLLQLFLSSAGSRSCSMGSAGSVGLLPTAQGELAGALQSRELKEEKSSQKC